MKKTYEPILFFGSGPVAALSLAALAEKFTVEAVITKPAPAYYHGAIPVLEIAGRFGITVYPVNGKQELADCLTTHRIHARIGVLVDFGIILPQSVINYFPLGIVNSHFSLLPEWRGADPITFAILSGQKETGVSLMLVVEAMDEGPLLAQSTYKLPSNITTPQLTQALIELSNTEIAIVLPLYMQGELQPIPQNPSIRPTYSRKLTKGDGYIDWHKSAVQLEREIRAYIEWPKSYTTLNGMSVIITEAHIRPESGLAGQVVTYRKMPQVFCGTQSLIIDRIKPAGKKEMSGEEFLRGYQDRTSSP
ncbi:MAG TPA: methionyl-tRNA formyltransferase [Candidatus Saccharimonadales bacterium]|nr:methionyl-tRNA formyltransferase [Candidatus Saccharimonadales bacterium]